MESTPVPELVERLQSTDDGTRKMAVFRLQSAIGDPSFADTFLQEDGLRALRDLALHANGNTLAYALAAFSKLLEVDLGWDGVDTELVKRVVELVVTHPLVNILRGAMSILASVVSHPTAEPSNEDAPSTFGFRALKPAIAEFPQFLEMLVNRLSSADHALCANALQLINALMRDAITHGSDSEWPKFIKRLQDLGVIRAVYGLMQGSALQDVAQPLLEFQALTKVLVRKWRNVPVDFEKPEHRRALKGIHISSLADVDAEEKSTSGRNKKSSAPDWKKLGFSEQGPGDEFEDVGFLGMMDLTDYVRKNETAFQRLLLEQATQPEEQRCPISRASIAVTSILFEHFDIEKAEVEDAKEYLALDSRESIDKLFKPMLLQWSKVHTVGLNAYLRIWKATGATTDDFAKISELLRILLEAVLGGTPRTKDVHAVEEEIQNYSYQRLRELQMELFELSYEDTWGQHLGHVREELQQEAVSFIKEQRIRCLLAGAWFSKLQWTVVVDGTARDMERPWGYVKLSHNRRYLHYGGFDTKGSQDLKLDDLPQKLDLSNVSSVVSNVTAAAKTLDLNGSTLRQKGKPAPRIAINGLIMANTPATNGTAPTGNRHDLHQRTTSKGHQHNPSASKNMPSHTKTNSGAGQSAPQHSAHSSINSVQRREVSLLTLHPVTAEASEWLDGLLMLLHQSPITPESNRLLSLVSSWGLKIRLLNVRYDDEEVDEGQRAVPSRDGLDDDYYYDVLNA